MFYCKYYFFNGGFMRRLFRLSFLVALMGILFLLEGYAQPQVFVSGRVAPGDVRVFLKDSAYVINRDYVIAGTLIIEPGTKIYFYPNGRLIDSVGGRIIADGDAVAQYKANPLAPDGFNTIDPKATAGTARNPLGYYGYADLNYFLYQNPNIASEQTVRWTTDREKTVHVDKYNYIFNVLLDKRDQVGNRVRKLVDFQFDQNDPNKRIYTNPDQNQYEIISYEKALIFTAARLSVDPDRDANLNARPWRRLNDQPVDIAKAKIRFIGQPVDNYSREWGHIIVLPGARAAFFRNCSFEGFRKDTTVDRTITYNQMPGLDANQLAQLNNTMRIIRNGSGGAITTFSSRTWLVDCQFTYNMARFHGGAIQVLQAPEGFPKNVNFNSTYPVDINPNITDPDGNISSIIQANPVLAIDEIHSPLNEPFVRDFDRQYYDDGRIAIYLGRYRNLKFERNYVQLANVGKKLIGTPPIEIVVDLTDEYANPVRDYGNEAFGGAIYLDGRDQIEVALGYNKSLNIYQGQGSSQLTFQDKFEAIGNSANNYQYGGATLGARGGAIYVGTNTSLIVAGKFESNSTNAPFLEGEEFGPNSGTFSKGGAIFTENTWARLQVRGGPDREALDNVTIFNKNKAGAGGAIYVDGGVDNINISPRIGGADNKIETRNYGHTIKFEDNYALATGGAIHTMRNMTVNGAGGTDPWVQVGTMGYGGNYPVRFERNSAGYSGGAINIYLPSGSPLLPINRYCRLVRAVFTENVVGADVKDIRNKEVIWGGGAIYSLNGDLNVVRACEFKANKVYNGNGGAIALAHPDFSIQRFFITDLDIEYDDNNDGIIDRFSSERNDDVFTYRTDRYRPDTRMMNRFYDNEIYVEDPVKERVNGSGTTQIGSGTQVRAVPLYGTFFVDDNTGFAVGYNGTIIKLLNGGSSWEYKNYNTFFRLNDVHFTSRNRGFVCGDGELIIKTEDGGETWTEVQPGLTVNSLNSIYFVGTQVGYVVGDNGTILKTVDGGNTWFNPVQGPIPIRNLHAVFFVNENVGWAVGNFGLILVTRDGGLNWALQFANTTSNFYGVHFTDANTGYIAGEYGVIYKTINGGASWTNVYSNASKTFNQIFFSNENIGYAVGNQGFVVKTTNAGITWEEKSYATPSTLHDVYFVANTIGYAVGDLGVLIGTRNGGDTWNQLVPVNQSYVDVKRWHQERLLGQKLQENGIGLGGAIYILDEITPNRLGRVDSIRFHRVRIQNNKAFTGAAVYSDNYDLQLIFSKSLITGNVAYSDIGKDQNYITGPAIKSGPGGPIVSNHASSDLAGAIIYGEFIGPLPSTSSSLGGNSIYNNTARFLIRLPDAYNTKGVLAGTTGIGYGGTDTIRGNYWGRSEANVTMQIGNRKIKWIGDLNGDGELDTLWTEPAQMETFFINTDYSRNYDWAKQNPSKNYLRYIFWDKNDPAPSDPLTQGPFEYVQNDNATYRWGYRYAPVPLLNGVDENTPANNSIPEKVLMSGLVYDVYDKGTDIKTADYSNRRMSPIEDFAVGIPPILKRYTDDTKPSFGKYVKRWLRDPFIADSLDSQGNPVFGFIKQLQDEFRPDKNGKFYHPIGYPVYLEAEADYSGLAEYSNHDPRVQNETVFFVINEMSNDYIRINLKQVSEDAPYREVFRARVDLVPDSSFRIGNNSIRRTHEGLANFGIGKTLLEALRHNPFNEDAGTLQGRKYHAQKNAFAQVPNLFSNEVWPPSNRNTATFYAGERFRALPVNVGDRVRIVSRTVLWKDGVNKSYDEGLYFDVVESTQPPEFTGNIIDLQNIDIAKIPEFLNTIFVTEDRKYPVRPGTYSGSPEGGRDSILTVTAKDDNKFFDPKSILHNDQYSQLTYKWWPIDENGYFDGNAGVVRWLMADTVPANKQFAGSKGYLQFRGFPLNPWVVPGGERVRVAAENYPPSKRTVDYLKQLGVGQDTLDQVVNIFQPYLNAGIYETPPLARYVQQDTINGGSNYTNNYEFRIFVVETKPKFLDPGTGRKEEKVRLTSNPNDPNPVTYVVYEESKYTCGMKDKKVIANLTDSLRLKLDFNTDDEWEDYWALKWDERFGRTLWDFRFGKTAYGFMNIGIRLNPDDSTIIDTTVYDPNLDGVDKWTFITQSRPDWMQNKYLFDSLDKEDPNGIDLTSWGKLNVRIKRDEAIKLLTPKLQVNGALNLDTIFVLVVNDGHGGINNKPVPVYINVAPTILTQSLPPAKEDYDYNPQLLDSAKMIKVFDPNFDQKHTFELIYADHPTDQEPKDPCYPEAGVWDLTGLKTTPDWLKINPISGLLYGTPGLNDAPKTVQVTVLVRDENGLTDVKTFSLVVEPTNHKPDITGAPEVRCIDQGSNYLDTILVVDRDLMRLDDPETLTLTVIKPAGLSLNPATIRGPLAKDTVPVQVKADNWNINPSDIDPDGKITIQIKVTDSKGEEKILTYRLKVSDKTDFTVTVRVQNHKGAYQDLVWGVARTATRGDGFTPGDTVGQLDPNFCEYELPMRPPTDIFDARWIIPNTNGITRNIYPRANATDGEWVYTAVFQSGGEAGNTSNHYPVTLSWNMSDVPDKTDATKNPTGASWFIRDAHSNGNIFNYNMNTGNGESSPDISGKAEGTTFKITINRDVVTSFLIICDWQSDVATPVDGNVEFGIQSVSPNPFANSTNIKFGLTASTKVKIDVSDALGNVVAVLTDADYTPGSYQLLWNGRDRAGNLLPSGTYTIRMFANGLTSTYPVVLVK